MFRLESKLRFPKVVHLGDGLTPGAIHDIYVQRVDDCIAILNRIIERWNNFHSSITEEERRSPTIEDRIRIEVIDETFSFITFLLLLLGFYRGIDSRIRELMHELSFDISTLVDFPIESGTIRDLRTIRNKMVAHTADLKPYKNDTMPNRYAYLEWYVGYWGLSSNLRNRQLNTFGVGIGNESSTHAIPPTFDDMARESESFIRNCENCIQVNCSVLANYIESEPTNKYLILGEYSP